MENNEELILVDLIQNGEKANNVLRNNGEIDYSSLTFSEFKKIKSDSIAGISAKEKLVKGYESRIIAIVNEMLENGKIYIRDVKKDDYISVGRMSLIKAAIKYDSTKANNTSFYSYARSKIEGELLNECNNNKSFSRRDRELMKKLSELQNEYRNKNMDLDIYEIMNEMHLTDRKEFDRISNLLLNSDNKDIPDLEDDKNGIAADKEKHEIEKIVSIYLGKLSEVDKEIMKNKLDTNDCMKKKDILNKFDITEAYYQKVIINGIKELQNEINEYRGK